MIGGWALADEERVKKPNAKEQAAKAEETETPAPELNEWGQRVRDRFPDFPLDPSVFHCDIALIVPAERLLEVCTTLRDLEGVKLDTLASMSAVDYKDRFQMVYHLFSLETPARVVLKVDLPRDNPVVDSVTGVWPTANWHEREAYDLMGIKFNNHPNLTRILLPEGFPGHPLRKDWVDLRPKRKRKVRPR